MCTFHLDICQKYWQLWSSGYCCQRHSYLEYEMNEYLDLNLNLQPKKFSINGDIKKDVVTSDAASSKRAMVPPVMIAFAFSSVFLSSFVAFLFFSLLCFFSGSKWASSSHIYTQTASMNLAFIHSSINKYYFYLHTTAATACNINNSLLQENSPHAAGSSCFVCSFQWRYWTHSDVVWFIQQFCSNQVFIIQIIKFQHNSLWPEFESLPDLLWQFPLPKSLCLQ